MKRIKQLLLIIFLGLFITTFITNVKANEELNIYFFHSQYCLHCKEMDQYLTSLEEEYDNINIIYYEISDSENNDLLIEVANTFNQKAEVPFVAIGGLSFVGYNTQTTIDIEEAINLYSTREYVDIVNKIINNQEVKISDFDSLSRDTIHIPIIGNVEIKSASLLLSALILGLVDGFNPCAMWVLVFLITMLINYNDRKRMWVIGITFLFTSALIYFMIMASWLKIAVSLTSVMWIRYLIGIFAFSFGVYHIINYYLTRNKDIGCRVTNDSKREKLMQKIKDIVKRKNLILALIGVILLAITVNIIELACSAGLPPLYTQILAYNNLSTLMYLFYISIYVFAFLIDDIAIFVIAMLSMKITAVSNRYSKYSTIIGGFIMILIGFLLIFFPNIIMFNF